MPYVPRGPLLAPYAPCRALSECSAPQGALMARGDICENAAAVLANRVFRKLDLRSPPSGNLLEASGDPSAADIGSTLRISTPTPRQKLSSGAICIV